MRGYFGIGIENGKKEINLGTLWRSAYCLGASFIFTIGARYKSQASDTTKAWRHIPLYEYENISEFIKNLPKDCTLVGIERYTWSVPLKDFKHPERAIYLLGPEDGSLSLEALANCSTVVEFNSTYCLNVAVAGSIVMYDREIKQ